MDTDHLVSHPRLKAVSPFCNSKRKNNSSAQYSHEGHDTLHVDG